MQIKRIFYHYSKCEEYKSAMWAGELFIDQAEKLKDCIDFMADTETFSHNMKNVILNWPNSCEANFTNTAINQEAWLGQAAAAYAISCPQEITKKAWGYLPEDLKNLANAKAKSLIKDWINNYLEKEYA